MASTVRLNSNAKLDLAERVKELSCLYAIARLAADTSMSMDKMLEGIVAILPPAWKYPKAACAKVVFDGQSYVSQNCRRPAHRQRAAIMIDGRRRGYVEVAYPKRESVGGQVPFLDEEQKLLDTVAREVAVIIMRREAERDKLKLEEQLRHADRLATIGQLAAGVAHELNEPLGHIIGYAQLVQNCPGLSHQAHADVDKIFNTSLYARDIVKKLLIFSRQMSPHKTKTNLNELVKNGIHFLQSRCVGEGIELHADLYPDLPEIDADPSQMNQVIVNMMVNAIQAMPHGGEITIRTRKERSKVYLTIEDTGVGIEEEILQKIFIPFFTTKEIGMGTGLGLPVAHNIITAHGGTIKAESRVGKGAKFRIQLPIKRNPSH